MIYQYKCDKCNKTVEIKKFMSQAALKEYCQGCGGSLRRIFNVPGVVWDEGTCWDYDKEGLGDKLILRHHA